MTHEQLQAAQRAALSLGFNITSEVAAAVFQAMVAAAPADQHAQDAQLDEMRRDGFSIDGDNAYKRDLLDCVVGALAFGKQGNPAPPEGHWLHRFWEIGDAERRERDNLRAQLAAQPEAVPDECPHLILFDDADVKPIMFAGSGARKGALAKWEQVSHQWNAHLFVRIAKNCRDDQYPCATVADPAAPQQGVVMPERHRAKGETPAARVSWIGGWNAALDEVARLNADRSAQGGE